MAIYEKFAEVYDTELFAGYSRSMIEFLPKMLERFRIWPRTILDIACGNGTFAVAAAQMGYQVSGIDASAEMLKRAQKKAKNAGVSIQFKQQDMREEFSLSCPVDLVTCWFDSINYILKDKELKQVFANVAAILNKGGFFLFDFNTLYGLELQWDNNISVELDTDEFFLVHRTEWDEKTKISTLTITGFVRRNGFYERFDEVHRERGYTIREVETALQESGLQVVERFRRMIFEPPTENTGRVFIAAKR